MNTESKENSIELINKSLYKILNFKLDLIRLYTIIYKFCKNKNIILSNYNININKINKENFNLYDLNKDFNFILLSTNPKKYSIELANILYNEYSKYITVISNLNNKEISISIDNNKIINFYLLFLESDLLINKLKLSNTITIKLDNELYNIYNSSDLIEILYITHKLYNPVYFLNYIKFDLDNYKLLIKENKELIKIKGYSLEYVFDTLLINLLSTVKKDDNIIIKIGEKEAHDSKKIRHNMLEYFINKINKEKYQDFKIVLLDNYAIDYYKQLHDNINILLNKESSKNNIIYNHILNIINHSKYLELMKNILTKYLVKNKLNNIYEIFIKKSNLYLYNDFRLTKATISLINKTNNNKILLLNSYNSSEYEVIPIIYSFHNIYIPHPLVVIRFILYNIINLMLFDTNFTENTYITNIDKIIETYKFEKNYKKMLNINKDKLLIFYYGIFIDERIEKYNYETHIYRPWQYFIKNNKLLYFK